MMEENSFAAIAAAAAQQQMMQAAQNQRAQAQVAQAPARLGRGNNTLQAARPEEEEVVRQQQPQRPTTAKGWRDYLATRGGKAPTYAQWQEGAYGGQELIGSDKKHYNNWMDDWRSRGTAGQNALFRSHGLQHDSPYGGSYGWMADQGVERLAADAWRPDYSRANPWDEAQMRMMGYGGGNSPGDGPNFGSPSGGYQGQDPAGFGGQPGQGRSGMGNY